MAINPNVNGSTDNPKWIDGGPGNTEQTFNLDNPAMWPTTPTLEGLVSGFCERAAIVVTSLPSFPAGLETWAQEAPADNPGNSAIADSATANIAKHNPTAQLFQNTPPQTMSGPGRAATSSNYMASFDSALTLLINPEGGYKTSAGTSYNDFAALAASAVSRAQAAGSAIASPQSGGGNYAKVFYPAYPVEWAKERKWMLEELRYTGKPVYCSECYVRALRPDITSSVENAADVAQDLYSSAVAAGYETAEVRIDSTGVGNTALMGYYRYVDNNTDMIQTASPQADNAIPVELVTRPIDGATVAAGDVVAFYFGEPTEVNLPDYDGMWYEQVGRRILVKGSTAASDSSDNRYTVLSGGTLRLTADGGGCGVSVSSGGTLLLQSDTRAGNINIMDGGVCHYVFNDAAGTHIINQNIASQWRNYKMIAYPFENAEFVYCTGITTTAIPTNTSSNFYLDGDGCKVTLTGDGWISAYITSGATLTLTDTIKTSNVIVESGGSLVYSHPSLPGDTNYEVVSVYVASGGKASLTNVRAGFAYVAPQGSLGMTTCGPLYAMELTAGATVTVVGTTISDLYTNFFNAFGLPVSSGWNLVAVKAVTSASFGDAVTLCGAIVGNQITTKNAQDVTYTYSYTGIGPGNKATYYSNGASPATIYTENYPASLGDTVYADNGTSIEPLTGVTVYEIGGIDGWKDDDTTFSDAPSLDAFDEIGGTINGLSVDAAINAYDAYTSSFSYNGFKAYAVNGGPAHTGGENTVDNYSSFRCRQFYTNPDNA